MRSEWIDRLEVVELNYVVPGVEALAYTSFSYRLNNEVDIGTKTD